MLIDDMAEQWYGYGRWEAPFWFLGPEPGGIGPNGPMKAWDELGRGELLDCREHHLEFGCTKWHVPQVRLQPTWNKLIVLLQSFKGEPDSTEARRKYQAERWGAKSGETCVIELCPVAAPALGFGTFDGSNLQKRRIALIQDRLKNHQPKFIVLYSKSHLDSWEEIVGSAFDGKGVSRVGRTIALTTPHPVAFKSTNADWIGYGNLLRRLADHAL